MDFSLHLLGFSSNRAISFHSQVLNLIKRLVHDKVNINFINIYFYAMTALWKFSEKLKFILFSKTNFM